MGAPRGHIQSIRDFVGDIVRDWIALMSGVAGLALTIFGFFVAPERQAPAFRAVGLVAVFVCCFFAWRRQWLRANDLDQRLSARLRIDIDGEGPPYIQKLPPQLGAVLRTLRVRVSNVSSVAVLGARLVVEDLQPASGHFVAEHELRRMGVPGALTFDLPPRGQVWVDVLDEYTSTLTGSATGLQVCYALAGVPNALRPAAEAKYRLVLRVEGAPEIVRCVVEYSGRTLPCWKLVAHGQPTSPA